MRVSISVELSCLLIRFYMGWNCWYEVLRLLWRSFLM